MRGPGFYFAEMLLFLLMFGTLSYIMCAYENIMNYPSALSVEQILVVGAPETQISARNVDLYNEGPVGYVILAGMGASALMFFKDFFSLQRVLRSLAITEEQAFRSMGGEKFV